MALYRKYRPATFAEVVGQEHVTDPLSTALDTGRISHAYLFSGPRGCGKTSSARILARSLNCVEGPTSTPCGVCASCVALGPGGAGNLDVIELDAASHGGVDDTRELRDRAFYAPAESRYRVFIVDEAHMVTTAGFNALLKIVEEPPAHLIFIFATTEPDKVLPTIRSRTHHYPFRLLPPATMRGLLGKICEQEHVPVEEAVYPLVIRAGGGSPRDSLSVLDQLLAGAGPDGVTYQRAVSLLGVTDVALIDDAVDALAADDGAALFGTIDSVMEAGHDPRRFAVDLLERLRDLILLRAVPDAADRGLVSGPGDVLERMRDQAERLGPATLTRYAELLHEGLGEMRGATAPRLLLEVICARMLLPSVSDAESATLQRLERLERGFASGARPAAAPSADRAPTPSDDVAPPAERPAPPAGSGNRRRGAELLAAARAEKEAAASGSAAPTGSAASANPAMSASNRQSGAASAPPAGPGGVPAQSHPQGGAASAPSAGPGGPAAQPHPQVADASATSAGPGGPSVQPNPQGGAPSAPPAGSDGVVFQPNPQVGGTSQPSDQAGAPVAQPNRQVGASSASSAPSSAPGTQPDQQVGGSSGPSDQAGVPDAQLNQQAAASAPSTQPGPQVRAAGAPPVQSGAPVVQPNSQVGAPSATAQPDPRIAARSASADRSAAEVSTRHGVAEDVPAQHSSSDPHPADQAAEPDAGVGAAAVAPSAAHESQRPEPAPSEPEAPTRRADSSPQADSSQQAGRAAQSSAATQAPGSRDEAAPHREPAAPQQDPAPAQQPAEDLIAVVEGAWAEIKGKVREFGPTLQALLSGAAVSRAEGSTIVFAHQSPPLAQRLSDPRNIDAVRSAVRAVLGRELDVRWETGTPAPRPAPAAKAAGGAARGAGPGEAKPAGRPKFSRPSQAKGNPAGQARQAGEDDIPPPDFPDLPDDPGPEEGYPSDPGRSGGESARGDAALAPPTPEEEQEMLAAAAEPVAPGDRQDPDEVALALLRAELGAKSLDG
ncbi:DNA polymerase III subunit gamma and tau [Nocardia neocaledoniensis]|uniref:DNA polymerase III subunit gamma and tau n=2 Tax=Nocardia neocaledoniensis TaxID=236511 RepID=UPI0031343912